MCVCWIICASAHYFSQVDHETIKKSGLITTENTGDNDVAAFLQDVALLQPIAFPGPPRIWSGLFHIYQQRAQELSGGGPLTPEQETQLRAETVARFGTRLQKVATGGAPTSPDVKKVRC
jgi:hypothetical protein